MGQHDLSSALLQTHNQFCLLCWCSRDCAISTDFDNSHLPRIVSSMSTVQILAAVCTLFPPDGFHLPMPVLCLGFMKFIVPMPAASPFNYLLPLSLSLSLSSILVLRSISHSDSLCPPSFLFFCTVPFCSSLFEAVGWALAVSHFMPGFTTSLSAELLHTCFSDTGPTIHDCMSTNDNGVIPIYPMCITFKLGGRTATTIERIQFLLMPAYAFMDCKSQGQDH